MYMANPPETRVDLSAAQEAAALYHGSSQPSDLRLPVTQSHSYMLEYAALTGFLIARTADQIIVPSDSELGFQFVEKPAEDITDLDSLQTWVQALSHDALDGLVESDDEISAAANRFQDLSRPDLPRGQQSNLETRRQTLLFQQSVFEPHAWLRIAAVAAKNVGKEIRPEQALPFVVGKLAIMQTSARRDVGRQYVRGAILEAVEELGEMHGSDRTDTASRYRILRSYVRQVTGHQLRATNFGDLYVIHDDAVTGVSFSERERGFGVIPQAREIPLGCSASYRMIDAKDGSPTPNSALVRLLKAGIGVMNESEVLPQSLLTRQVPVSVARNKLDIIRLNKRVQSR
jgi:hypothetical protein